MIKEFDFYRRGEASLHVKNRIPKSFLGEDKKEKCRVCGERLLGKSGIYEACNNGCSKKYECYRVDGRNIYKDHKTGEEGNCIK